MKRLITALLSTSILLAGCGNDSTSSTDTESPKTSETKQVAKADQDVLAVYQAYQDTLGKTGAADAKALAKLEYTGEEQPLRAAATGAKNLNVTPGKVVKSFQQGDVAYIIHEFNDADGSPLPNRASKLFLKKDGEWKVVIAPTTFEPSVFTTLAEMFDSFNADEYGVNAKAAEAVGNTPEDKQDKVFTRVNAQTDYMALEMNSNILMIYGMALGNDGNPEVLVDYYSDYADWYTDEQDLLRKTAKAGTDYEKYLIALDPLKESLQKKLGKYADQLNMELG
ncbi:hypothetical protein [Exiguobacterium sp. s193]|uniref:hypothetical protein n=1 Tax=Exiguobacterium sp. s193 TaxID=2751207 RepID=UPI001BE5A21C|nr:hypothetical protein [Exiguobacterium sp. s193]